MQSVGGWLLSLFFSQIKLGLLALDVFSTVFGDFHFIDHAESLFVFRGLDVKVETLF